MAALNLKSLIGKLNDTCRRTLEQAAGLCLARTNYNVELEHWLLKLTETNNTDFVALLRYCEIDASKLARDLTKAIDRFPSGNARAPALSPDAVTLSREGWLAASVEFGSSHTRSGHLLYALLSDETLSRRALDASAEFEKVSPESLKRDLWDVTAATVEAEGEAGQAASPGSAGGGAPALGSTRTPALDQFTIDLTARAAKGEIDPVVGRDAEVRLLIDILTRRRKNNPILVGEAGVGKTAVVEGLAQRIIAGDLPEPLRGVSLRTLDLGLLQAGAGIKGEFENRLKGVIDEVKSSPRKIILFIDEAHTMVGAGGAAGQGDAANLLKPALARGELRTIAATTWAEYKKHFEKDPALARRFEVVKVEEPSEPEAVQMMRGVVATLEQHHNVRIMDEAVIEAVRLSHRYISGRQLPDKCFGLLDTACARVAVGRQSTPAAVEDCRRRIEQVALQYQILSREASVGGNHEQGLADLQARREAGENEYAALEKRWREEAELVGQIRTLREKLEKGIEGNKGAGIGVGSTKATDPARGEAAGSAASVASEGAAPAGKEPALNAEQRKSARADLARLSAQLKELQGESPLMQVVVDAQAVAEVVAGWTGIPVGRMVADEINTVLNLKTRLEERIIGQGHALEAIAQAIRTSRANMTDPRKPTGVFLMVGTSGVGKTETAVALAELLYGGDQNMTIINMSEFKEEHKVSLLMGSPPGYVGYGEGGVLTEAVRRKPYSVVLLDEMEKAHPGVQDIFFQVFDKGMMKDGEGRDIDFKNTLIIMTSNAATDLILKLCADPDTRPDATALAEALHPELIKTFKPAFLGRVTIIPYFPLSDDVMRKIIELQLGRVSRRVSDNYKASFSYDPEVVTNIADRCKEVHTGGRNVEHVLTRTMLPELSAEFLSRMAEGRPIQSVRVGVDGSGGFRYTVQ